MEYFYKITKEQAASISKFLYAENKAFDPFCSEQTDGTYLVSENVYEQLKDHENFKKITWSQLTKITSAQISTKVLEL